MAVHIIKVPDIGEGIAEVELVEWHVQPGDNVAEDQILAEVMTDKATVEVPSAVAGTVVSLGALAGQTVAVGAELIRLEVAEGDQAQVGTEAEQAIASFSANASEPLRRELVKRPERAAPAPTPQGAIQPATRAPEVTARPLASPSVRRHARELEIELSTVQGSGPDGRITHDDLQGMNRLSSAAPSPAYGKSSPASSHQETTIPVIGLRRKIAEKMQESHQHIPHATYVEEVDMTELERLRERLNDQWGGERGRLTLLPFLIRAMVLAIADYPEVNARFDDESFVVTRYGDVHVGIATQTESGLKVPVLRDAQSRDLWSTAAELHRLAEVTRDGTASREELAGSTITVTSLGALGGIVSTPIINYPEVAIVGVNRIVERPMIHNGMVAARQMMNLSSSFDHRLIDGYQAAQFIQAVRRHLECPAMLFIV